MTVETKTEAPSDFEALLGEINDIAKAHSAAKEGETSEDDAMIEAAAEEAEKDEKKDHKEPDGDEVDGKEPKEVKKSLDVELPDGTKAEVIDAGEIFKSISELSDRVAKSETDTATRTESVLGGLKTLTDVVKSLSEQVATMAATGRGRKTVVNVAEKPQPATEVAKAEPGVSEAEFWAKAEAAQREGRITSVDVAKAEGCLRIGAQVPEDIRRRVFGN